MRKSVKKGMKTIGRNVFFWFHALEQGIGQKSEYT